LIAAEDSYFDSIRPDLTEWTKWYWPIKAHVTTAYRKGAPDELHFRPHYCI
jgi:hypothetical protein